MQEIAGCKGKEIIFLELFAGRGKLTSAAAANNVLTCDPDEVSSGGTDFTSEEQIEKVRTRITGYIAQDLQVVLHMAPPCSTFSRARDRSDATKLRSLEHPAGDERDPLTAEANLIARNAYQLLLWSVERGCMATLENPADSYIWGYYEQLFGPSAACDIVFPNVCLARRAERTPSYGVSDA